MDYKTSGVDVEAGRNFVNQIKSSVESTHRKEVLGGLGGFGGLIRIPEGYKQPILVAGADGVGTKLELAQTYNKHVGVGIDLVAMCVNDVITTGARPLFFLDYIATGSLSPTALTSVVEGIAQGCKSSGCALLGGETAEMPGFYQKDKYDLAGFCVGVVEEADLVDGQSIQVGDQIIGIQSSGVHSNGFSLVRKVLSMQRNVEEVRLDSEKISLIQNLLTPTYLYAELIQGLLREKIFIHGMAHITGGGLPENLPRCLPKGFNARIDSTAWKLPLIFQWLKDFGNIPESDLWNTFNLGIGFCLIVPPKYVHTCIKMSNQFGFSAWNIGEVEESSDNISELKGLPF